jgi:hypothetical protein
MQNVTQNITEDRGAVLKTCTCNIFKFPQALLDSFVHASRSEEVREAASRESK